MQALKFIPSFIVPFTCSMTAIYAYSRLLPAAEYGRYILVFGGIMFAQQCLFMWLQMGAKRFGGQDSRPGPRLFGAIYGSYAACAVVTLLVYLVARPFLALPGWPLNPSDIGLVLLLVQSLVFINQGFVLADLKTRLYTLIESAVPITGLAVGLVLVAWFEFGAGGTLLGLLCGSVIGLLLDLRGLAARLRHAKIDTGMIATLLVFGLPLALSYALDYILSASDRFLLDHFAGAREVGIYAVSYGLGERFVTSTFLAVALGGYPAVLRILEQAGPAAARAQALKNVNLTLLLAIPACGGVIAASNHIAAIIVGPEFAAQAAVILPWIAVAAFLNGIKLHYFDHAFHFAKKTSLDMVPIAVAAVLNVGLNLILLPRIGWMGAVYSTLAAYVVALVVSVVLGWRVFPLPFPFVNAARSAVATLVMMAVLRLANYPATVPGLTALIMTGMTTYAAVALLLDAGGCRTMVQPMLWRLLQNRLGRGLAKS